MGSGGGDIGGPTDVGPGGGGGGFSVPSIDLGFNFGDATFGPSQDAFSQGGFFDFQNQIGSDFGTQAFGQDFGNVFGNDFGFNLEGIGGIDLSGIFSGGIDPTFGINRDANQSMFDALNFMFDPAVFGDPSVRQRAGEPPSTGSAQTRPGSTEAGTKTATPFPDSSSSSTDQGGILGSILGGLGDIGSGILGGIGSGLETVGDILTGGGGSSGSTSGELPAATLATICAMFPDLVSCGASQPGGDSSSSSSGGSATATGGNVTVNTVKQDSPLAPFIGLLQAIGQGQQQNEILNFLKNNQGFIGQFSQPVGLPLSVGAISGGLQQSGQPLRVS